MFGESYKSVRYFCLTFVLLLDVVSSIAILIAEEKLSNLTELVLLLQEREESMKSGFTVPYKDEEFKFFPSFIDRYLPVWLSLKFFSGIRIVLLASLVDILKK